MPVLLPDYCDFYTHCILLDAYNVMYNCQYVLCWSSYVIFIWFQFLFDLKPFYLNLFAHPKGGITVKTAGFTVYISRSAKRKNMLCYEIQSMHCSSPRGLSQWSETVTVVVMVFFFSAVTSFDGTSLPLY